MPYHRPAGGSLAWVEQGGRRELPNAVFRSAAISRLSSGASLSLDLPSNATDMVARLAQGIQDAAAEGFLVRARADADTVEARSGFTARRDAVFAAGAQVVASDFIQPASEQQAQDGPKAVPLYPPGSLYRVALPGGREGRCLRANASASGAQTVPVSLQAVLEEPSGGDAIYCGPLEAALAALDAGAAGTASSSATAGDPSSAPPQQQALQPEPAVTKMSAAGRRGPLAALAAACLLAAAALL